MSSVEQRARDRLADAYDLRGWKDEANALRSGMPMDSPTVAALDTIAAALREQPEARGVVDAPIEGPRLPSGGSIESKAKAWDTAAEMEAYARANVTAALASAQAREDELRAEVEMLRSQVRTAANFADTAQELHQHEKARAERLEEAWSDRQCAEFMSVAMRHCKVRGTFSWDDIRMGQSRAQAFRGNDGEEQP